MHVHVHVACCLHVLDRVDVLTRLWENGNCMHMRIQYGCDLLPITYTHMHMRLQYGTPYYMLMRKQYDSSYYGIPQFAYQPPGSIIAWTLRIIPRGWCVASMRKGNTIPASARPARPRSS